MSEMKTPRLFRAIKGILRRVYPKMEILGLENLPEGEAILVGNHAQIHGPVACELYLGEDHYTWCAGQMMNIKEVPAYAFQDFWSMKPRSVRWLFRIVSYLIAPLSSYIFNNANTIAVYRDARILTTFHTTVDRLKEGARIVVFPEQAIPYNNILCRFQERFVDVARLYYARTKKEVSFVPMYITPKLKKMVFGKPIPFRMDRPIEEERQRICQELMTAITQLAQGLPQHIVIPYLNVPKSEYPLSKP